MALCEMCGRESRLVTAEIEGGELRVCNNCAKFGKIKSGSFAPRAQRGVSRGSGGFGSSGRFKRSFAKKEEPQFGIVKNYSSLIRASREKKGLSQEDFAKSLNEKESIVAKWEHGTLRPRIDVARRLEKVLGIKLVKREEDSSEKTELPRKKSDELTLGDFIKVRKRK